MSKLEERRESVMRESLMDARLETEVGKECWG